MFKKFIPFAHAKSIYDLDLRFLVDNNVKTLIMDLDNTLDSYKLYKPTPKAFELIDKIRKLNIRPIIISNNHGKRVSSYANELNVEYISSAKKPFPGAIKKFIKFNKLDKCEIMMIGDQMMTDVLVANKAGIRIILTEKLVKEDQWTTHINRIFGRRIRKYHQKHNNLREWSEIWQKHEE